MDDYETLDGIDQSPEDVQFFRQFAKDPKRCLLITGKNGRGKSYVARAIYNYNILPMKPPSRNWDWAFFSNQSDLSDLWEEYKSTYKSSKALLSEIRDSRLLVIDDLGTRKPTDSFHDFLYSLIDYRYENRHQVGTIITTNLNSKSITDMFGNAILSRIAYSKVLVYNEGEDRRKIKF